MRVAICDDNYKDRSIVKQIIERSASNETVFIVEEYADGSELITELKKGKAFDLIFLDIKMKKIDGFKTADYIRSFDKNVMIVFITSLAHFISKAFLFEASGYLVKPIQAEDVVDILVRSLKRIKFNTVNKMIVVETKNQVRKIDPQRIIAINVEETRKLKYILFNDKNIIVYGKLKNIEDDLVVYNFIKIARGTLINLNYVLGFDSETKNIILQEDIRLPASIGKWEYIKKTYAEYLHSNT